MSALITTSLVWQKSFTSLLKSPPVDLSFCLWTLFEVDTVQTVYTGQLCLITRQLYSPVYSTCVHTAAPNTAPKVEQKYWHECRHCSCGNTHTFRNRAEILAWASTLQLWQWYISNIKEHWYYEQLKLSSTTLSFLNVTYTVTCSWHIYNLMLIQKCILGWLWPNKIKFVKKK